MTLEYIFETFKSLESSDEKVEYIRGLEKLNLPYDFNYTSLIKAWESVNEASTSEAE